MLGGIGGGSPLDRLLNGSQGMGVNRMLDALGLPDALGDMIGAQIDLAKGDLAGYARNMMDLTSGMSSDMVDKLFGRGLPGSQFVQRPFDQIARSKQLYSNTFHTPYGDVETSREKLGKGLFAGLKGKALEAAAMANPAFKAALEAKLGGRIILDGRIDGQVTVERFKPHFGNLPFSNQVANNPMLSGIYGGLARLEGQLKNLIEQMTGGGSAAKSGGANGLVDASNAGGASGTSAIGSSAEDRELAAGMGIDMKNMSFEDLLFMMMMKYAKKKEKEIISKMNELSQGQGQQKGADGKDKPYGDAEKTSDTLKQMQMQKLMEDLKKMYEMLSNVMKSMNDMQMAAVRNLR